MTEKEKLQAGLLYDANYNPELQAERDAAAELCYTFNTLRPAQRSEKDALLQKLLGKKGKNCTILPPFHCDYGSNIFCGDNFFANYGLVILDPAPVTFGDNVFIAPQCGFYGAGHPIDAERRNQGLEYAWPITVGSDVWFGGGVRVMPGVTIGSDVVIGSGSVVTRDIPSHCVAAGNPCRVLRPITEQDRQNPWIYKSR